MNLIKLKKPEKQQRNKIQFIKQMNIYMVLRIFGQETLLVMAFMTVELL